jgi:outer membrane protein assembly factor BamD (BamD/ComL family)
VYFYLGRAYQKVGQQPKALEAFEALIKEYPGSRYAAEATQFMGK